MLRWDATEVWQVSALFTCDWHLICVSIWEGEPQNEDSVKIIICLWNCESCKYESVYWGVSNEKYNGVEQLQNNGKGLKRENEVMSPCKRATEYMQHVGGVFTRSCCLRARTYVSRCWVSVVLVQSVDWGEFCFMWSEVFVSESLLYRFSRLNNA